jgi:hypothetical protein
MQPPAVTNVVVDVANGGHLGSELVGECLQQLEPAVAILRQCEPAFCRRESSKKSPCRTSGARNSCALTMTSDTGDAQGVRSNFSRRSANKRDDSRIGALVCKLNALSGESRCRSVISRR